MRRIPESDAGLIVTMARQAADLRERQGMTAPDRAQLGVLRKVRKNPDFIHNTRELDRLGIEWTLHPPRGTGHPYLEIGSGGLRYTTGSTPRGSLNAAKCVADLRRWLRLHGFDVR